MKTGKTQPNGEQIQKLVEDIANIFVGSGADGRSLYVCDVIADEETYQAHREAMEKLGIALTGGRPGRPRRELAGQEYIFLDWYALRMKYFEHVDRLDGLLIAMGGERFQHTCGGKRTSGIRIPLFDWRVWFERVQGWRATTPGWQD